jgi:hypothetical protein
VLSLGIIFGVCSYFVFRFCQPIAFTNGNFLNLKINPQFLSNLKQLQSFNHPEAWYPPSLQWIKTQPLIFPLKNLVLWGLGLPLGIISLVALSFTIFTLFTPRSKPNTSETYKKSFLMTLMILWILGLFFYQGFQFVKTMRYFLPLYPFLAIISGAFMTIVFNIIEGFSRKGLFPVFHGLLFSFLIIYPLSFVSIYTRPVTRVAASSWIYENAATGITIANEHWDDPLPLPLPNTNPLIYKGEILPLYDPDTEEKWGKISDQLNKTDYLVLSSNRLSGSIPQNPERYPKTSRYYEALFEGSLGFEKVAEFTSYPCFPPFGKKHWFCLNDSSAEEAFTVYDHPKVIIFKKLEGVRKQGQ